MKFEGCDCNWKCFALQSLFDIRKGKRLTAEEQTEGKTLYIGAIDSNNGVAAHIGQEPIHLGNTISLSYNGSVGEAFYQEKPYWATDDVNALYCKYAGFNKWIALFIVTVLRKEKYRFSYGRKWTLDNMKNTQIKLPIKTDDNGVSYIDQTLNFSPEGYVPDWQFMEDYIKSLHYKPAATHNKPNCIEFFTETWKEFRIGNFFDIHPTKAIDGVTSEDCVGYGYPLVVNSAENNGIAGLCNLEPTEAGNIITFSDTTDGNTFFYQPEPFIGFAHVQGMYPTTREWSSYELLFLCAVLMFDSKDRYSYGRKMRRDIISEVKIKLPVSHNEDGSILIDNTKKYSSEGYVPDWQFMEDYIRQLPYGDRI